MARASTPVTVPVPHVLFVLCSVSGVALCSPAPLADAAGPGGSSVDMPFEGARRDVEGALVQPGLEPRVALRAR